LTTATPLSGTSCSGPFGWFGGGLAIVVLIAAMWIGALNVGTILTSIGAPKHAITHNQKLCERKVLTRIG
jgi:hypothetical protein